MLSKQDKQTIPGYRRIRSSEEYGIVLRNYFCSNHLFTAYAQKNNLGISRLGIIVSKRIIPKAAGRNYVKRMIREGFRKKFPSHYGLDLVIRSRRPLGRGTTNDGHVALAQILSKVQTKCVDC